MIHILRIIFIADFLRMICNMILSIRNNEYDCKAMTRVKIEAIVDVVAAVLTFILCLNMNAQKNSHILRRLFFKK